MASRPLPQIATSRIKRWMIDHDHTALLVGALDRVYAQVWSWQERAHQRRMLRGLDDHLLKDIGRSRAEAEAEGRKPFWR